MYSNLFTDKAVKMVEAAYQIALAIIVRNLEIVGQTSGCAFQLWSP
jgi:hypothetical protein